jgi:nucleoid DNA-binding protein
MRTIDQFVSDLLYEHECVIIPGFGGFITSYAPARIHPVHHTFSPPSKDVLFNTNLKRNDGLLANYIAEKEGISFTEALNHISTFTEVCHDTLRRNQSLVFENIGTFRLNAEGSIQFIPDTHVNYLNDAYGLTRFTSPAIKRQPGMRQQSAIRFTDRTHKSERGISSKIIRQSALLALPLLALLAWGYFNNQAITDFYTNYTGVVSFKKNPAKNSTEIPVSPKPVQNDKTSYTFNSPFIKTSTNERRTVQPAMTDKAIVPSTENKYYVMAGAFRDEKNALTLIENLKKKGYQPEMVDTTGSGLFRISYQMFTSKMAALEGLAFIKSSENPDAWILKK